MQAGYEGDDCQVDIDECEQHPCHNGGKCFQRSDVVNYRKLPELSTADFSYDVAAGFICHCLPGFTGKPDKNHLSFSACASLM